MGIVKHPGGVLKADYKKRIVNGKQIEYKYCLCFVARIQVRGDTYAYLRGIVNKEDPYSSKVYVIGNSIEV